MNEEGGRRKEEGALLLYEIEFLGILLHLSLLRRGALEKHKESLLSYFVSFVSYSIPVGCFPVVSGYRTWLFLLKLCSLQCTVVL